MPQKLTVLKLGGSIVTRKKLGGGINKKIIRRIAQEIKKALKAKPQALILVHGAGGRAHSLAHRFGLQKGALDQKAIQGAWQTHREVSRLQTDIAHILTQAGLAVLPLPSDILFYHQNHKLNFCGADLVDMILKKSWIPLLNGDMILDDQKNFSILSGDTIAAVCAQEFRAGLILFASDVDGVYTANPHQNKSARLLKRINPRVINALSKKTSVSPDSRDTTGEMMGKLAKLTGLDAKATIRIFNGLRAGNITLALTGQPVGTAIKLQN